MVKPRIVETEEGIQGEFNVETYDHFMRGMRDRGWIETNLVLKAGITQGLALEVGPGPGYLGLEWLKKTEGTKLKALEISPDMITIAERNAKEYGLQNRANYVKGDAREMPFDDNTFDGAFTNGSLHEWSQPKKVLNEIHRVLKPRGRYLISDLRRDMNPVMKSGNLSGYRPIAHLSQRSFVMARSKRPLFAWYRPLEPPLVRHSRPHFSLQFDRLYLDAS